MAPYGGAWAVQTSREDLDYVLAILPRIVEQARAMAPTFTP